MRSGSGLRSRRPRSTLTGGAGGGFADRRRVRGLLAAQRGEEDKAEPRIAGVPCTDPAIACECRSAWLRRDRLYAIPTLSDAWRAQIHERPARDSRTGPSTWVAALPDVVRRARGRAAPARRGDRRCALSAAIRARVSVGLGVDELDAPSRGRRRAARCARDSSPRRPRGPSATSPARAARAGTACCAASTSMRVPRTRLSRSARSSLASAREPVERLARDQRVVERPGQLHAGRHVKLELVDLAGRRAGSGSRSRPARTPTASATGRAFARRAADPWPRCRGRST